MNILKKTALGVCASLLFSSLFGFGLSYGLYQTFNTPDTIKTALKESGAYDSIVESLLKQAEQNGEGAALQTAISDPQVQKVVGDAVSPTMLQGQTEQALDGVYAWMQGKTPKLEFALNLENVKQSVADNVAKYAEERAASLPACTPATMPSVDADPLSVACLPPGVSPSQLATESKNRILNDDFFKDATLTPDKVKSSNGKTLEQQLQAAPTAYKRTTWLVYATGLVALLMIPAVILLSSAWRAGVKRVAIMFVVAGLLSAALSWLTGVGIERLLELVKEPLQQSLVKVAEQLTHNFRNWWLWYGVALSVAGIVVLIVLRITRPKAATGTDEPKERGDEAVPTATFTQAQPMQKPKPIKKLVQ